MSAQIHTFFILGESKERKKKENAKKFSFLGWLGWQRLSGSRVGVKQSEFVAPAEVSRRHNAAPPCVVQASCWLLIRNALVKWPYLFGGCDRQLLHFIVVALLLLCPLFVGGSSLWWVRRGGGKHPSSQLSSWTLLLTFSPWLHPT